MYKIALFLLFTCTVFAQKVKEPKAWNADWHKPYPPFKIVGNVYYVGTYDLACYLIVTPKGNILINTGLAASEKSIKNSIKALGFRFSDIKILLNTQAHYDHTGALASVKKQTKAKLFADYADAPVLADGGSSDYALGGEGMSFVPIKADRLLHDGDIIELGGSKLYFYHHPGHTKGSNSYVLDVKDGSKSYRLLIANMPTIVTDKAFNDLAEYPNITQDFAQTIQSLSSLRFDLWVASHASQFNMHSKHKPGDRYNPEAFRDQAGFDSYLADLKKQYLKKLEQK